MRLLEPDPEACDRAGNTLDAVGACGGGCTEDADGDGICDTEDDCVGEYDFCGVCNGPGPILGCGYEDIPDGYCDCNGNVLDAGTCGGACQNDFNGDGICDDDSIPGCTYEVACNYDPSASIYDGSCDFTSCYGCTDPAACNYSPPPTSTMAYAGTRRPATIATSTASSTPTATASATTSRHRMHSRGLQFEPGATELMTLAPIQDARTRQHATDPEAM